ncbi:DNA primase [Owenweeksia hongkongensis]|uniref:DNA primase n=1 Tax=Owenweeksia hongkongensis TaxID=253245 RepID=UPI003A919E46
MISNESIDKIFETARIEEVIADFVTLKKAGSSYKGLSPFVNEKTPSFIVSPAKQIYKDFSSGKGGNVVSFLMEHEHYSYPEALKWLAARYNIEVEETGQTDEQKQKRSEKESLYLVNEFANRYFQDQLWKSEEGKNIGVSYFKERGFTEETIKKFQLGYSPNEYEAFTKAAQKEQYSLEFLVKSGVTKEGNGRTTDRFRGRVMFPILSHTGRVLGFGGRTLMKDAKIAKYLNSPESEIYHKSKTLYGIFQAKNELSKQDNCLLVEGYTDVISLNQAGVKNVVASSGTSLTKDQIVLIKRYTKNVTILYDGDSAGIKASLRGIDMILEEGLNVQVLLFPDGEDPDSFAKKVSSTELTDYIKEEKQDFLRFKAALLLKEAGSNPLEKSKAARDIVESIAVIPDALQRNAYIQECAHVLQMQERILFTELAQVMKNVAVRQEKEQQREEKANARLQVVENESAPPSAIDITTTAHYEQERSLCWLLLNYGQHLCTFHESEDEDEEDEEADLDQETVAEYIVSELAVDEIVFNNSAFNEILESFTKAFDDHGQILNSDYFVRKEGSEIVNVVVDLVTEKHELHDWQRQKVFIPEKNAFVKNYTIQAVLRYKEKRISDLIRQIQTDLKNADNVAEELVRKIETFNKLNQLRAQIDKELNRVV